MGSCSIVYKWMLEFSISDLKDDRLIMKMLSVVPMLKDDVGLKKIVLLRAIECEVADFSVSEKTLDALEIAFELDRKEGFDVLESMKMAYCSVAVDCVARFLKSTGEGEQYFDAVKRIWRKRIGQLFAHNVGIVSEQLETWRDTIESAIWDGNLRSKLFGTNTRYEALIAIRSYLVEAWKTVGPKFTSNTSGRSLVEAQLLCLQRISEPNKGETLKSFATPQGLGDSYNRTAQVWMGSHDPSSLVSSPLLKNKEQGHLANRLTQNKGYNSKTPTGNKHEEGSKAFPSTNSVNLHRDENVRFAVCSIAKEQNLLQTSYGLTQDQFEEIESVHVTGKAVEAAPLHGMCANNSFDHDDHVEGEDPDVVKEQITDLPSPAPHGKLQYPNNSKACCEVTRKVRMRRKHVGGPIKLSKRVRINDSGDVDPDGSNRQHNPLSETEVVKILEKFKSSSRELQDLVKDPLPDALHVAETVLSDLSRSCVPQGPLAASMDTLKSCDVEVESGKDEAATSYIKKVRTSSTEGNTMNLKNNQGYVTDPIDATNNASSPIAVGDGEKNLQNEASGHENRQRRANLWEKNASTRAYEWDDSADGSPEENFSLPTPKTYVNSPLKKYECTKFARRRQIKRWSVLEEDTLRAGVQSYGRGNWKMILNAYRDIFEERTEVDLKDKWRRMTN